MNFNLFVARRLFRERGDSKKVSRPAIVIATAGVAVGLAVMIIAVSVALGFKQEISSKVTGFGSHIQVLNYAAAVTNSHKPVAFPSSLIREISEVEGVSHVERFCNKEGILKTDEEFKGILLHGVDSEYDFTFLKAHMEEGEIPAFSDSIQSNQIVISRKTADELHLTVGSRVFAYFFEKTVRTRRFTVAGIYCTHLTEFDKSLVFTDFTTCNKLNAWNPEQCTGVELKTSDFDRVDEVTARVRKLVNPLTDNYGDSYVTMNIRELYPQIFAWLSLLDVNVWVILALMVAVAGFTMVSGLLIIILERTNFIGVMKALGATNSRIRHIFLHFALLVMGRGLLWGNVVGVGFVVLQHYTGLFHLNAEVYYIDSVPVTLNLWYILTINAATLAICALALIVPSFLVSRIRPAKSIRFD